ncbi:MAG: hypothetical protein H6581_25885 [Bacteroidia bacterium]|nr:hypothetical protein [Bacteroidia bacterium]
MKFPLKYLALMALLLFSSLALQAQDEDDEAPSKPAKIKKEVPPLGHKDARLIVNFGFGGGFFAWNEVQDSTAYTNSTGDTIGYTSLTPYKNGFSFPVELGLMYEEGRWSLGWTFGWKTLFADTLYRGKLDTLYFKGPRPVARTVAIQAGYRFFEKDKWGVGAQIKVGGFWLNEEYKDPLKKGTYMAGLEFPVETQVSPKFILYLTPGFEYMHQWGSKGISSFQRTVIYTGCRLGFRYLLY